MPVKARTALVADQTLYVKPAVGFQQLGLEYGPKPQHVDILGHAQLIPLGDDGIADDVLPILWVGFDYRDSGHRLPRFAAGLISPRRDHGNNFSAAVLPDSMRAVLTHLDLPGSSLPCMSAKSAPGPSSVLRGHRADVQALCCHPDRALLYSG